ncbi:MAG: DinB family protein [Chitinophagaceae bacterium]
MNPEYWLRGPVENITPLLQPVAHALLQARDEVQNALQDFPNEKLWIKQADLASVGFHLQHLTGVLDRLFTYARGEQLHNIQLQYLAAEGKENTLISTDHLINAFAGQVDKTLEQLHETNPSTLTEIRGVGKKQIPSTVTGLLFHAAEHTMRHTGQLLVTVKWVMQE